MRFPLFAALSLSFALAACSGDEPEESGEALDSDEVVSRMDEGPQLRPGRYQSQATLLEFEVPGVPASQTEAAKEAHSPQFAREHAFCLTPEQAEGGPREMVQRMAESNCSFGRYDVTGSSLDAEMTCRGGGGFEGSVAVNGTIEGDSSSLVMETIHKVPGLPGEGARMKLRMDSRRIGDCPAGTEGG